MTDRNLFVKLNQQYLGTVQGDDRHQLLVNTYNQLKPLPRGIKATTAMAWCAIQQSALALMANLTDIIVCEMGTWEMYQAARNAGIWRPKTYTPKPGDIIFYDWDKNGAPNHVGCVETVGDGFVTAIEGNNTDGDKHVCSRRTSSLNDDRIFGFMAPNYSDQEAVAPIVKPDGATDFSKSVQGNYSVTTGLYLRKGPGVLYRAICAMPKNSTVLADGYFNGAWYHVRFGQLEGFCSSKYLKR